MIARSNLRLTPPAAQPTTPGAETAPDSYRLEHRAAPRHNVSGHVTAVRQERDATGVRNRICSLQMLNMSDTGVGALSPEPVEVDSRIAIFFPPHGPERGFDLFGRVVRCVHRDTGHEVGIALEQRMAA
jgi:hypothetical protein